MPVAKTTPWASPPVQLVPLKTRSRAVSRGTSTSRSEAERSAGADSPVSADMSTSIAPERRRTSAAIRSPSSSTTTSPGTSSTASISRRGPVAQRPRLLRDELRQGLHRALGLHLLHEGEGRVEQDDQQHRDRHLRRADDDQQQRGDPQQQGQRVGELAGQLARPAPPAAAAQLVRPVLGQPPPGLDARQALSRAAQIPQQQVRGLLRVQPRRAPPTPRAGSSPRRPIAHRARMAGDRGKAEPDAGGNTPMNPPAKAQRIAQERRGPGDQSARHSIAHVVALPQLIRRQTPVSPPHRPACAAHLTVPQGKEKQRYAGT